MDIRIVEESITKPELEAMAKEFYVDMIKGVVDVSRQIIAVGGQMHSDSEAVLLKHGSHPDELWGFNLIFDETFDEAIEYNSLINIRPRMGNRSATIQDEDLRKTMKQIIIQRVVWE